MSSKKMQHEILLRKIAKALRAVGYRVSENKEPHEDRDDDTPHRFSQEYCLEVNISGLVATLGHWIDIDKMTISAEYECLDTNAWIYSDTEVDSIYIVVSKQTSSSEKQDASAMAKSFHGVIVKEAKFLIDQIKAIHANVRLHACYDSIDSSGKHSAASYVGDV